jgi:hypothetical protein
MQMNWRLLTAINAGIALITVSAVIFGIRGTRPQRARNVSRQNIAAQPNLAAAKFDDKEARNRVEALTDISNARVDDLGAVPGSELTHLMNRVTPEQLAALALKFNDAPTDARTFGGMGVFFQAWTELDPKAALTGAFKLNDVAFRKLAAITVVNSVSPSAAPELIAMLTEHPDKDLLDECKKDFLDPLIASWSLLDPEAASKFMDELGNTKSSLNSTARENIAYNWGTLDPSAALEWVGKQGDKDYINHNLLYNKVVRGWCRANLPEAAAYVRQRLDDENASTAASSVAEAMFGHDPDDATTWVGRLPEGNPRNEAESTVASTWSQKDPAAASRWMSALPEKEQGEVAGVIMSNWANTNWPEASRWIDTLSGDVRDTALAAAMNRQDASESDSLGVALRIGNGEIRQAQIERVIRDWTYNDAEAAEAWVKGSPLSPEQQQRLLKVISDTQPTVSETPAEEVNTDH